ncbi:MAG TPA: SPOR domain-containing protein [Casimicrobiaceae bacterium]|nr:SPOR domain-containing protein [Casimicrobiaceae bacterium]
MSARSDRRPAPQASKPRAPRSRKSGFGGTLLGLFVGLVLGLALAAGVAFYLMKGFNPFQSSTVTRDSAREPGKETTKAGRPDAIAPEKPRFDFYKILPGVEEPKIQGKTGERASSDKSTAERAVAPEKADAKSPAKSDPRAVSKADERATGSAPAVPGATAAAAPAAPPADAKAKGAADRFWLQAGSFSSEADAEDLKARLAFAGWEASVQSATLPDKSVRYRVRLGPYDNADALLRMKSDLAARGFDVAVIKF